MKLHQLAGVLAIAGLLIVPALSAADPIGPTVADGCVNDSCNGGIYTLSYDGTALPDADPLHETFRITYTIDTSGVTGVVPTAVAIDAAAIKVSASVFAASLFSAPGGVGNWNLVSGGISAGGCSGSGAGFECADWVAAGVGAAIGGTLQWVFDMTVDNGTLFTGPGLASIKARYVDSGGNKIGALVSEPITLQVSSSSSSSSGGTSGNVPAPSSSNLALLGMSLLGATLWMRRRSDRSL